MRCWDCCFKIAYRYEPVTAVFGHNPTPAVTQRNGWNASYMKRRRRQFLRTCIAGIASSAFGSSIYASSTFLRVAFLHLASIPGDIDHNRRKVEDALRIAAAQGAHWVITPELCVSGYGFAKKIGTEWISEQPDAWTKKVCALAEQLGLTVFLGLPERDARTGKLYNAVLVISREGTLLGRHRKINTLKVGAEAWSQPGDTAEAISVPSFGKIGILICSDAFSVGIAQHLHKQGVELLISPAAWAPGLYGPSGGEWEKCSTETGLPIFVCNRTGTDLVDFTNSESVVIKDGTRLVSFRSAESTLFTVDWDVGRGQLLRPGYQTKPL